MKRKTVVAKIKKFPSGLSVSTPIGDYLIQNEARLRIGSDAVRKSWSFPYTLHTEEEDLKGYPILGNLGFRAGTVFWSLDDGLYYLVEKNMKRQIVNSKWFDYMGIDRLNVIVASREDSQLHRAGEVLN